MGKMLSAKDKADILWESQGNADNIRELLEEKLNQKQQFREQQIESDEKIRSGSFKAALFCACLGIINPFMFLISLLILLFGMIMSTDW